MHPNPAKGTAPIVPDGRRAGRSVSRTSLSRVAPSRADWVITGGRVALALSSLLGFWFGPLESPWSNTATLTLLVLYAIHACVLFFLLRMPWVAPRTWPLATHLIDLAVFSLLMFFTQGPTSPFFVYFVFSVVCGTLRWGTFGAFWTAVIAISVFLSFGAYDARVLADPAFEVYGFLLGAICLAVVATLIGYLGLHGERAHREVATLAGWPQTVGGERQAVVRDAMGRVAAALRARRVVLVWEQPEEPSTNVVMWEAGAFEWTREPPGLLESFLTPRAATESVPARLDLSAAPSWVVRGQGANGELFFLDPRRLTADEMALGEVAARLTAATLDSLYLLTRLREAVASEERVRLARNLHDSVLQSLTGVALQLQTARQLLDRNPRGALARFREMQETLAAEQHRLRNFIKELRPFPSTDQIDRTGFGGRLADLCDRIQQQWGMRVELVTQDEDHASFAALHKDISYLVNEALINAARHAQASWVSVDLAARDGDVRIEVVDDGHGFPFSGRYDLDALVRMKTGPDSLKDRVLDLSGQLEIDSSPQGARLIMTLPIHRPATRAPASAD